MYSLQTEASARIGNGLDAAVLYLRYVESKGCGRSCFDSQSNANRLRDVEIALLGKQALVLVKLGHIEAWLVCRAQSYRMGNLARPTKLEPNTSR